MHRTTAKITYEDKLLLQVERHVDDCGMLALMEWS